MLPCLAASSSCWLAAGLLASSCPIPALKFLPFGWIVVKPATQIAARRWILAPGFHMQRFLFHPAQPQTFDKETRPILFRDRLIHSFDLDRRHIHFRSWDHVFFRRMIVGLESQLLSTEKTLSC